MNYFYDGYGKRRFDLLISLLDWVRIKSVSFFIPLIKSYSKPLVNQEREQ
jgi:hypothetical protein